MTFISPDGMTEALAEGSPQKHDSILFTVIIAHAIVRHGFVAVLPRTIALGLIGLLFVGLGLLSQAEAAGSVTVAWYPGASSSIAGYRLYYGTSSGSYPNVLNVGNTTTATVAGLTPGQTYYFVVTDYNTAGLESLPSNQVSFTVSPNQFPAITPVSSPADFNGDGESDLLWRNKYTGDVGVWIMNGNSVSQAAVVGSASFAWQIIGVADLNGDAKSDIVWYAGNGHYGV